MKPENIYFKFTFRGLGGFLRLFSCLLFFHVFALGASAQTAKEYFEWGDKARIKQNYKKATESYAKAIELGYSLSKTDSIAVKHVQQEWDKWRRILLAYKFRIEAKDPSVTGAELCYARAMYEIYSGNYEQARIEFEICIELKVDNLHECYNGRGKACFEMGELWYKYDEKAIKDWEKMEKVAPSDYTPRFNYIGEARRKLAERNAKKQPETPKEKPNTEDKTPPTITFENLPTNSPSKAFALNGWAKDASGVKSIQINNEEIPFFPNGRFEKDIQLKQGQNSILVQASDLAGNTSKKMVNLAYQFTGKFPLPKRLALVVGNGQYQPPLNLQKPRADAEAISEALKNLNFEVITLYDANKENMDKAIDNFKERLKKENFEVALFYFAGHGAQVEHSLEKTTYNFLAPVDAKLKDAERVNYECVNAQLVMDLMTVSGTKVNIMLLDACRDNPFHASRGGKIRTIQGSDATKGSVISYATSAGGLSLEDGEGKNSRYTTALLKYIGEPNRSIVEIMQDVTKEVSEKTKNDQIPSISSSLTSNFYFVVEE